MAISGGGDPSQFASTPNAALANAANRRLMGGGPINGLPDANGNIVQAPALPASQLGPFTDKSGMGPTYAGHMGGHPTSPDAPGGNIGTGSTNPLSGGTGDPALDSYLGTDATYQSQLSDLMRNYDQYNAQKNLTASQTQADYDAKQRALNDQATQDRLNMRNAAAARGILYSGIYANQLGQYNTANQQQLTNLLGGLQNSQDNANLAYTNFVANEIAAKNAAIQQAAARRASQLGMV